MTVSDAASEPWYRALNASQWKTLAATNLGWLFDGFETYTLILTVGVALRQLLDPSLLHHPVAETETFPPPYEYARNIRALAHSIARSSRTETLTRRCFVENCPFVSAWLKAISRHFPNFEPRRVRT